MPATKHQLIRYRVLDNCFQRRFKRWTKEELLEELSNSLRELSDTSDGVSPRTLASDISNMRRGVGGEAPAPIECDADGQYYYEDPTFQYFLRPLTTDDAEVLQQVLAVLRQFQGLGLSERLNTLVGRVEKNLREVRSDQPPAVIEFEQVPTYTGTTHLQELYRAIRARQPLLLRYQAFDSPQSWSETVHPYLLKQYNHRWFLIGSGSGRSGISNFALDRILSIASAEQVDFIIPKADLPARFREVIGVSVNEAEPAQLIQLRFYNGRGQYVRTKPLHPSQQITTGESGTLDVTLFLQPNRELETAIMSFGDDVEVLAPLTLRDQLQRRLIAAAERY